MTSVDRVAVVGMGVALPGASSPERFWDLLNGDHTVLGPPLGRFRAESFLSPDPHAEDRSYTTTGGFLHELDAHPRLAEELAAHRFQPEEQGVVLLRHCLLQAVDDLTVTGRGAMFVGAYPDGLQSVEEGLLIEAVSLGISRELTRMGSPPSAGRQRLVRSLLARHHGHTGTPTRNLLPDRVVRAAAHGVLPDGGERTVVDAACASGLYALDLGVKALLDGSADLALCGGLFVLGPRYCVTFAKLNGLAHHDEVRVFDEDADGTLFSDGAAVVALKRLSDAVADDDPVLAVVAGVGLAADGHGKAIYAPNPSGQRRCVERARHAAGVTPGEVDWVIAHGSGTPTGDEVEITTLRAATPASGCTVTSNKSLVGHTGWSAGAVSLVHALLALRHGVIPAQCGLRVPMAALAGQQDVTVPRTAVPWPRSTGATRTVGVSAIGFGGANAHVILRDHHDAPTSGQDHSEDPVVLVAWTAHLPGAPEPDEVLRLLRDGVPEQARAFADLPLPTFDEARLSPAVTRQLDRGQHLALRVAHRFVAQHGEMWAPVRDRTGVVAACTGPTRLALDNVVRCYAEDLRGLTALPAADAAALAAFLDRHRATTTATGSGTLTGMMPNVLAARLANRYDLHGPALSVDTGRTSALTAIHTAGRYLRGGDLDLALVVGTSADRGADLAAAVAVDAERIAEGAFLLALCRRTTASEQGWPVLATLDPSQHDQRTPGPEFTCGGPDGHTYLGADGLALVLHAAHQPTVGSVVPAPGEAGPRIVVTPIPRTRREPEPFVPRLFTRSFRPTPATATAPMSPAFPAQSLVLVNSPHPAGLPNAHVVTSDSASARALLDREDAARVRGWPQCPPTAHVRVIVSLRGTPWPAPPGGGLLALHELAFLAAAQHRERLASGSFQVLLLDPFTHGVPHPHGELFSGLAQSLRWELADCDIRVVATDADDVTTALRQLDRETREPRTNQLVRYRSGRRETEVFEDLPEPAGTTSPAARVVVAAGGSRGITAPLLVDLARRHRPRMWLLGSTELAPPGEVDRPGDVREAVGRIHRQRRTDEAQATLRTLRELCGAANVHYVTCDVTRPDSAVRAAERVMRDRLRVDLVVYSAGLNRSAALGTKSLADFRAVRDTKLLGYHNLKLAFAASAPRRWISFSSVLGALGYPGESDYASANAFLGAAARSEQANGTAEQALAWGLWAEVGMGASALHRRNADRSGALTPMSTDEGVRQFAAAVDTPAAGRPDVLYLGDRELRTIRARTPGALR